MFHKLMRFGFGGLAVAAALVYVSSASTIAGYQPAFANVITLSSDTLSFGAGFTEAAVKAVHQQDALVALGGGRHAPSVLNKAISPNILSAALAPTSVSGWRSGRVRTLAG